MDQEGGNESKPSQEESHLAGAVHEEGDKGKEEEGHEERK